MRFWLVGWFGFVWDFFLFVLFPPSPLLFSTEESTGPLNT